ncbi:MAG: EAL domain-containing protein [Burkholderiales bacterium PBB3]|nr:MAG: EAL domain-containing protein [Burkholderiales bacterium PBB3]
MDTFSIARQPIVDADRSVVAYELFNRSRSATEHSSASDLSVALNAVAQSGAPLWASHHDLFLNTVPQGLVGDHWEFLPTKNIVVKVRHLPGHDPQAIAETALALADLKRRGFRLCFHHTVVAPAYKAWQPLASFVSIETPTVKPEQLGQLVAAITSRTSAKPIAQKVEHGAQFEALLTLGVEMFQGYWFSKPEVLHPTVLSPGQISAMGLFNLLRAEAPIEEVEQALKKDAALGVNLLRIINSAGVGLNRRVTSLRQAVMLMGYKRLARWSAMLLTTSAEGGISLVSSAAVVRARMMEMLALQDLSTEESESAFLVGLLSLLDRMLGTDLQQALGQLSLDDAVVQSLVSPSGKYSELLALASACESDDEAAFSTAFSRLGYSLRQINMAHMEALAWSDALE